MEKENKLELKKHVATIHANNKMSLIQRKLANALLYNAYPDLHTKSEFQISIRELCHLTGYNSNDYKMIKQALIGLLSMVIEWNLVDKDLVENVWNASAIIADASIQGSICTYSYSNKMRELLHNPLVYGRLNMQEQARFKSSYGLALYENCIRYQNIKQTPWFDLPLFRKLMGVSEDKYLIFRDFKKRVIDIAIREVNQHADIKVLEKYRRAGRNVDAIKFTIEQAIVKVDDASQEKNIVQILQEDFGITATVAAEVTEKYESSYIEEKIKLIESSPSFKQGKINSLAVYLMNALEQDYQPPKSSSIIKEKKEKSKELSKEEKEKLGKLQAQYHQYLQTEVLKSLENMQDKKRNVLLKGFEKFLSDGLYASIYAREGLNNILIRDQLVTFMQYHYANELSTLKTFKEYSRH